MSSFHSPKLELKYCERCGGIWIRPQGGEEVYCARCIRVIRELPAVDLGHQDDTIDVDSCVAPTAVLGGACA